MENVKIVVLLIVRNLSENGISMSDTLADYPSVSKPSWPLKSGQNILGAPTFFTQNPLVTILPVTGPAKPKKS